MPSALFADVGGSFSRRSVIRGTLRINGKTAAPENVTMPVLAVVDRESDVVPPSSVVPFLDALPDREWTLLDYEGDIGVALRHLGGPVGQNAIRDLVAGNPLLGSHERKLTTEPIDQSAKKQSWSDVRIQPSYRRPSLG